MASTVVRSIEPTREERANGWTAETLERYRAEREAVPLHAGDGRTAPSGPIVAGNVVTEFRRPRPMPVLIGAKSFNPHRW